ncbi:hypothetical protein [Nakamurella sp.]|uniref:hypothetical protein n=1 Tax=Nakamurella sp. TaxID=1869182 RepID=UPI003B3B4D44
MTITLTRPTSTGTAGRHRLGRPGLIPASTLVVVVRRGWLSHLLRPARHRLVEGRRDRGRRWSIRPVRP